MECHENDWPNSRIQMINTCFAPIISFLPHFLKREILFTAEKEIMQPGSITALLAD